MTSGDHLLIWRDLVEMHVSEKREIPGQTLRSAGIFRIMKGRKNVAYERLFVQVPSSMTLVTRT